MPVERVSSDLDRIVSPAAVIEELGRGYGGAAGPAEGPLWWKEDGFLLFNDIGHDRMLKWTPEEGVTLVREPANHANGLTRDQQGRLIACEHGTRSVVRHEKDGSVTVMANRYLGRRLNSPNDAVVKSDGSVYFTDPPFGLPNATVGKELDVEGVFRIAPDRELTLLVDDMVRPNGLAFSPDESVLYVNDSRRRHIRAFDMLPDGMPDLTTDRVFCDLSGDRPGVPDGMKVDTQGNVYCGGSGGIWILDSSGQHLGTIVHGERQTTNVAWGGDDWRTLFFTTVNTLGRMKMEISGVPVGGT